MKATYKTIDGSHGSLTSETILAIENKDTGFMSLYGAQSLDDIKLGCVTDFVTQVVAYNMRETEKSS